MTDRADKLLVCPTKIPPGPLDGGWSGSRLVPGTHPHYEKLESILLRSI